MLQTQGCRPGLLSRGYKSLDASGNDESRLLDQFCPGVPHLQSRDRALAGQQAIREHGCDVLVLDDGFQHRWLERDLDLVLLDSVQPWGFSHLLPRGLLREPISSLRRASAIVVTRADQVTGEQLEELQRRVRGETGAPMAGVSFPATRLVSHLGESRSLESLQSLRIAAFCGIGNPEGFRRRLEEVCHSAERWELLVLPDHHAYGASELERLAELGRASGADLFLTTRKDLVKIPECTLGGIPLWAVDIETRFDFGEDLIRGLIDRLKLPSNLGKVEENRER